MTGSDLPRRVGWRKGDGVDALLTREWLVTNGLGGYASGTIAGVPTRRFHGLLIAALASPRGRTMMLNHLVDEVETASGQVLQMSGEEPASGPLALPDQFLTEFRLEGGRPIWRYEHEGFAIEKRIIVPHQQNTVFVVYRLTEGKDPVQLTLRPALDVRPHEGRVEGRVTEYRLHEVACGLEISTAGPQSEGGPVLRLAVHSGSSCVLLERARNLDVLYRVERSRGYDFAGRLFSPGAFQLELRPGSEITLQASTEPWEQMTALTAEEAEDADVERRVRMISAAHPALHTGLGAELVLAADQFIITPHTRPRDEARLRSEGDDARTTIAGYHWFTDWGRDTMISLEGLTLLTGRAAEARFILDTFAHYVRDGLIPNLFPEGGSEGLYHTADATLWFFHAIDRYEQLSGDAEPRRMLLPKLVDIIDRHVAGTRFGIGVDPADGLLRQGAPGYQLTWMDAKVGDWVVTPRRGKAVEINALFHNALRLLERWLRDESSDPALRARAGEMGHRAEQVAASFNRRFWYEPGGHLYDVVDGETGDDPTFRPNQLFAISLPHPVLDRARWAPVLLAVRDRLLTPVGIRSLAPGHPDYKPVYYGDLRARDAAYHQGTIWGWLIGPFVDAWLCAFPDDVAGARSALTGFEAHLGERCIGTVSEIFDAEPPFTARGCVAQAWSVAEALRAIVKTT